MQTRSLRALLVAGALLPALALQAEPKTAPAVPVPKHAAPDMGGFGFDLAGMDKTAAPGEDWLRYANGTYTKNLVIPADQADYGMFLKLRELSKDRTRTIVEAAAARKGAKPGSEAQKVGDFYASFMDEKGIEAKGLTPLKPHLDAIAALADKDALVKLLGAGLRIGHNSPIRLRAGQDLKHPDLMSVSLGQGGLGLPDRDYYLEPKFAEIRTKYLAHITAMLKLAAMDQPEAKAQGILDLETKIARTHWTRVESRQVEKRYNPVKMEDLAATYPGIDWKAFLEAAAVPPQKELIMGQPSAIQALAKLIENEPLNVWKDYCAWHALSGAAAFLPKAFVEEEFAFEGKVLGGKVEDQARWKRGVDATSAALGEAVGKLYVAKYFPPESKHQMDLLVKNIIAAMDVRLSQLTWMDPKTKEAARAKLAGFTPKIGYPDKWRDYSKFEVRRGDALGNAMRAHEFEYLRQMEKLGKPIDRSEWGMTPMTVNAYANPTWNEIVFPAAILQAPFFDAKADPAVNYGGIGVVIGHEISHHFDDQGRKYDKDGKLSDWWTAEDISRFKAGTDKVVKQYAAYEPLPGVHVNGELTLGENMADLAGINVSLDAYHKSLGGKPAKVLNGYTGDQRFFLGFAQVWRSKYRDPQLMKQITTDPHTPGFLRPNVVRNIDAWYEAFGVKEGQALYLAPADRIKVW
jgi:putative endopeptidase